MRYILIAFVFIVFACQSDTDQGERTKTKIEKAPVRRPTGNVKPIEDYLPEGFEIYQTKSGPSMTFGHLNKDNFVDFTCLLQKAADNRELFLFIFEGSGSGWVEKSRSLDIGGQFAQIQSDPQLVMTNQKVKFSMQTSSRDYSLLIGDENGAYSILKTTFVNKGNAKKAENRQVVTDYITQNRVITIGEQTPKTQEVKKKLTPLNALSDKNIAQFIGADAQ